MCLAIPGKIIKIEGDTATLDYDGDMQEAKIVEGDYKIGDYALVKAKIVVEKVSEEQMEGWLEVLKGVENVRTGG